ncbi:hypothetical protein GYMLUDRAFT_830599 [Collybiopsis luxurians FD-317 M1]|uniref:Uncharacterized protein n=1 Tax=Collybiopsis luxurians FD-317 M1 TaxID=944289 RepID=A0A0D0CD10_9AGAR|nr:hypothetical protein GYMLUDRAFT_830599 [Collybiopsis luxurians FD-317 M1]
MFHQAQNFTISHSNFNLYSNPTIIQGNPRNHPGYEDEIDEDVQKKRHRQHSYLDDFKEVRRGDMIVLQRIPTRLDVFNHLLAYQANRITARREPGAQSLSVKIEVIKLASKKREKKFMAITYEGDDAHERWRRDLESFARVREGNSWQLIDSIQSCTDESIRCSPNLPKMAA